MKTRYKIGEFNYPITVCPGDLIKLTLTEKNGTKQKVTEDINVSMEITHWVMFYVTGVGLGGMFGTKDIGSKIDEIFVKPELINDKGMLIEDN